MRGRTYFFFGICWFLMDRTCERRGERLMGVLKVKQFKKKTGHRSKRACFLKCALGVKKIQFNSLGVEFFDFSSI